MARKSNDSELKEVWQGAVAAGDDGLRRMVERAVQQVLETEMTAFLGVDSYERSDGRRGYRNGYKPRTLKTRVGELELMVPKDRDGQFQSELFERYQRSEKALVLAITQMYVEGVSTRKVRDITEALCGLEISKTAVIAQVKAITDAPTLTAARKTLSETVESLGRRNPRAAALLDQHGEEILAVYQLPDGHRKRMRSTNMLERVNQEIKRRTRVIRIFPNEQACARLISTLMMELNQEWMERLYLRMDESITASTQEEKKVA
jgi:transposase-like protein